MQITLPDDLSIHLQQLATQRQQRIEQFIADHLRMTINDPLAQLPSSEQAELQALHYLSDDALRTIAAEQLNTSCRERMAHLMAWHDRRKLSTAEQHELATLVERGDQLMLRKAEAIKLLHQRGYPVSTKDFMPSYA